MATYVNDLRLKEIATGDESGTWGTSTNTNLELVAEAWGSGSEAITGTTHTITMADGTSDAARAFCSNADRINHRNQYSNSHRTQSVRLG